jgi:hypothetical protein
VYYFVRKYPPQKPHKIVVSQSRYFSSIGDAVQESFSIPVKPKTQSFDYEAKHNVKIVFHGSSAYWIVDNTFFVAEVVDGKIDATTQKVVDTITVNKVELERLSSIVDILTEGDKNDRSNPGNKKF